MNTTSTKAKGFTLLELLIVIAIIAILATIIVIIINPVEILKRARDVQRLSDLASTRTAIALYLTTVTDPSLDGQSAPDTNDRCKDSSGTWTANSRVYYSANEDTYTSIDNVFPRNIGDTTDVAVIVSNTPSQVDGEGWIPIDLGSSLSGSSPLSNFPLDPLNILADQDNITYADTVYRYACRQSPLSFEMNARLESIAYTETDNKLESDGGDNDKLYEIGTRLDIFGSSENF